MFSGWKGAASAERADRGEEVRVAGSAAVPLDAEDEDHDEEEEWEREEEAAEEGEEEEEFVKVEDPPLAGEWLVEVTANILYGAQMKGGKLRKRMRRRGREGNFRSTQRLAMRGAYDRRNSIDAQITRTTSWVSVDRLVGAKN